MNTSCHGGVTAHGARKADRCAPAKATSTGDLRVFAPKTGRCGVDDFTSVGFSHAGRSKPGRRGRHQDQGEIAFRPFRPVYFTYFGDLNLVVAATA